MFSASFLFSSTIPIYLLGTFVCVDWWAPLLASASHPPIIGRPPGRQLIPTGIVKLERTYETEYGFPSTHSMCGLVPLALVFAWNRQLLEAGGGAGESVGADVGAGAGLASGSSAWGGMGAGAPGTATGLGSGLGSWFGYEGGSVWFPYVVAWGVWYALSVGASRLYLGVHSVLDVGGGLTLGAGLLAVLHRHAATLDRLVYVHPTPRARVGILLGAVGLLGAYPRPAPWSVSYFTTCTVVGTWVGLTLSLWYVHVMDADHEVLGVVRLWGLRAHATVSTGGLFTAVRLHMLCRIENNR